MKMQLTFINLILCLFFLGITKVSAQEPTPFGYIDVFSDVEVKIQNGDKRFIVMPNISKEIEVTQKTNTLYISYKDDLIEINIQRVITLTGKGDRGFCQIELKPQVEQQQQIKLNQIKQEEERERKAEEQRQLELEQTKQDAARESRRRQQAEQQAELLRRQEAERQAELLRRQQAERQAKSVRFGLQLSPVVSWLKTDDSNINPEGANVGLKLGLSGEYYFRDDYAISTGIGFHFNAGGTLSHKYGGFYWTKTDLPSGLDTMDNNVKLKYSLQYVEIPIGIKMRTNEFGNLRYFITSAITVGLNTKASGRIRDNGKVGVEGEKYDILEEVKGGNMTWGLTGGVEYNMGENSTLVFGAGFQIGFTDLTADNGTVFDPNNFNRDENTIDLLRSIVLKMGIMF